MIRQLSYLDWKDTFWQYLMTVVSSYPDEPSQILKKKMYRFISDVPSLVPDPEFTRRFLMKLQDFPASPYLDSRASLSRWLNFFRNRIAESYNEDVKTEEERWEQYSQALGPTPPKAQQHPRWYALVGVGVVSAIVILLALQNNKPAPVARMAPWAEMK